VLDNLKSREAALVAVPGALPAAALFAATHPSRTTALVVLEGNADPSGIATLEEVLAAFVAAWGTGEYEHVISPDMPWNEEVRATWARMERLANSPATLARMLPLAARQDVRAVLPTIRVPTPTTSSSRPRRASTSPTTYRARSTSSCRGATCGTS
jgi:pimeloyl-ACP methyl ester carboxylesterase